MMRPPVNQRAHAGLDATAAGQAGEPCEAPPPDATAFFYPGITSLDALQIDTRQACNLVRRAALHPRDFQLLIIGLPDGEEIALRLKNAPGGRILLHPEDAGTPLAAALGSAMERLGCLHKLAIAPAPFDAGKRMVPVMRRRP